jgi:hypothetical protein
MRVHRCMHAHMRRVRHASSKCTSCDRYPASFSAILPCHQPPQRPPLHAPHLAASRNPVGPHTTTAAPGDTGACKRIFSASTRLDGLSAVKKWVQRMRADALSSSCCSCSGCEAVKHRQMQMRGGGGGRTCCSCWSPRQSWGVWLNASKVTGRLADRNARARAYMGDMPERPAVRKVGEVEGGSCTRAAEYSDKGGAGSRQGQGGLYRRRKDCGA